MGDTLIQVAVSLKEIGTFVLAHWEWVFATAILPIWKYGKKIYHFYKDMSTMREQMPILVESIKTTNSKLDKLFTYIAPNGGGSISDALVRMEKGGIISQQMQWSEKDSSKDGFFLTDENGLWTKTNKTFQKMVSATAEDCKGNGWIEYLTNTSREEVVDQYREAIEEKRGVEIECAFRRDYAGIWYCILSLSPTRNDGKIIAYTGTIKLKP